MLQPALLADLRVSRYASANLRSIPLPRLTGWAKVSFAPLRAWVNNRRAVAELARLNDHLRRDIGLSD